MKASRVWAVSDPHLFHLLVSGLRDFATPEDFNAAFEEDWRSKVKMSDQVWLLGDLTGGGHLDEAIKLIHSLPGIKHLIIGNHDHCFPEHRDSHRRISQYFDAFDSVQLHARRSINGTRVLVSHFPYSGDHSIESRYDQWRLPDYGIPIVHGHTHSSDILSYSLSGTPQINIAWEAVGGLVTFDSLQEYIHE